MRTTVRKALRAGGAVVLAMALWWIVGFGSLALIQVTGATDLPFLVLPRQVSYSPTAVSGGLLGGAFAGLAVRRLRWAVPGVVLGTGLGHALTRVGPLAVVSSDPELTSSLIQRSMIAVLLVCSVLGAAVGVLARRSPADLAVFLGLFAAFGVSCLSSLPGATVLPTAIWTVMRLGVLAAAMAIAWRDRSWTGRVIGWLGAGTVFLALPALTTAMSNAASRVQVGLNPDENVGEIISYGMDIWWPALSASLRPSQAVAALVGLGGGMVLFRSASASEPTAAPA